MKKKMAAFILCMCVMTAGTPWSVSAENVQESVQGTEGAETLEETEDVTENTEQDEQEAKGRAGENAEILHSGTWNGIIWSLDSNGKLVLDGSSEDYWFDSDEVTPWYDYQKSIVRAEVKGSGWKSAAQLFAGCSNLVQVDMSSWDTSNVTDMAYMFSGCSNLTSLDLTQVV